MVKISKSLKSSFSLLMSFLILQGFTGCKDGGDGFAILEENLAFIKDPVQPTGNVGITFDDGKYDFGVAEAYETSTNLPLTLTNGSGKNLYFGGLDFGDANQHFSVISTKCPESPSIFPADFSCEMIVAFSPQAPEVIITLMAALYGETEEEITLKTEVFAQGRGVSSLDFEGITDIDNPTTTSLDIFWESNPDIVNYNVMIALGETPDSNDFSFKKSVPNSGGAVSFTTIDGLTPGTFYSFKVNVVDLLGNTVSTENFETGKTLPNNAPDIDQVNWLSTELPNKFYSGENATFDVRDASTLGDTDVDGDPITYSCKFQLNQDEFTDPTDCSLLPNQDGTSAIFNQYTGVLTNFVPKDSWVGRKIKFTIRAKDPYNIEDEEFSAFIDIEQGTPLTPTGRAFCNAGTVTDLNALNSAPTCTVPSPNNVQNFQVIGDHKTSGGNPVSGDQIFVYSDDSCTDQIGTGTTNTYGWFAVDVTLPLNQLTKITLKARNPVGNTSVCSTVFTSIEHDNLPPSILTLDNIYPAGPSYKTDPQFTIQSDANVDVALYENFVDSTQCSGLITGSTGTTNGAGVHSGTLDLSSKVSATTGSAVPIYVQATDAAGNSACSSLEHTYYVYRMYSGRYTVTQTEGLSTVTNPAIADMLKLIPQSQTGFSLNGTDEIQVPHSGDLMVFINLPVAHLSGQRSATRLYVEVVDASDNVSYRSEFSQSSYVRGLDGHYESSTTLNTVIPAVAAGDYIRFKVEQAGTTGSQQVFDTSANTTVYVEYLDQVRPYYAAEVTGPVDGSNIANFDYMPISTNLTIAEKVKSSSADALGFSVGTDKSIVIPEPGSYLVTLNVPFSVPGSQQRCAPQINLRLEGNLVGIARQAYIRGNHNPYHRFSSNNWIGVIQVPNAGDELLFELSKDGSAGDCNDPGELRFSTTNNAAQEASVKGMIYVEKIDTSYGFTQFSSAGVINGGVESEFWNQTRASNHFADLEAFVTNDNLMFSLDPSAEEVTVQEDGMYLGGFNAAFQTTAARGNVKVEALLEGNPFATSQSAYIRNGSSHVYSSTGMSFQFDATSGDKIKFRSSAGSQSPTDFNSLKLEGSAKFFFWKRD